MSLDKFTAEDIVTLDAYGFQKIAKELGETVTKKNFAYGDAAAQTGKILEILYPYGVRPDQYQNMLLVTRILDKLSRVAQNNDPFGECPFGDIAGYGIIGKRIYDVRKANTKEKSRKR